MNDLDRVKWRLRWYVECTMLGAFLFVVGILMPETAVWKTGFCTLMWGSFGLGASVVNGWLLRRRSKPLGKVAEELTCRR